MTDIVSRIRELPEMEHGTSASGEDIERAESALKLKFAPEYREYLSCFGSAWSAIMAISGITDDEDYEVVALTESMREYNPQVPPGFYAIEDVGVDGLVIWQDETGAVYQTLPNIEAERIFDSLSDFLGHQIE